MKKSGRQVFDYYDNGQFLFRLGHVNFIKASPPLETHSHGVMSEFVILEKGSQLYQVAGKSFIVHQGEIFTAFPHEVHNSGNSPEEKASLFYLIIDLNQAVSTDWGCCRKDKKQMGALFGHPTDRIQKAHPQLLAALYRLQESMASQGRFRETRIRNSLSEVLILILESSAAGERAPSYDMRQSLDYIRLHIKEDITIEGLAELEHMSLSTFKSHFTRVVGIPPGEYILRNKIERIKLELGSGSASITDLAYEYGFSSSQYFATVFKRFCYVTPSQFRQNSRSDVSKSEEQ